MRHDDGGGLRARTHRQQFDRLYATNVKPVWLLTRAFKPLLLASHGSVVNIGSDVSIKANPAYFGYSDTKAAVVHITKMMALSYAPDIRVNAVCPGDTYVDRWASDEQLRRRFGDELAADRTMRDALIESMHKSVDIPMKRVGEVSEIARAVLFLASPDASYITGVPLLVDGGSSII